MPEKIIEVKASEQFEKDYREYALYTERHRTTPEFRDGLKPVQRRIIYASYFVSHASDKRKSATVVGDTMGHYHPHGDSSIQGALYQIVNWFQTKMPLFIGQGNFGNTYQNVPAAARYTEVKLSPFALDCLLGELIECKEIVDWEPTYDNSSLEPMFLPSKLPLLLINGCSAISVGDRVDIPSHNINEVIDETIALIRDPNRTVILIPDHCQNCDIIDTDWVKISKQGFGTYKIRGRIDIEPYKGINNKYKDCQVLAIKSCPNYTFLETVVTKIKDMIAANKIIGIIDEEEQSGDNNMRYVFVLKPGTDPNYVRNEIFKNTVMQQTCRVNMKILNALDKQNPTSRVSYTGYLNAWIQFRKITKLRYYEHRLQKVMTRLHMVENYIWAIKSGKSDEAIEIIKKQKTLDDDIVIETLIKKLGITDLQAKFFINSEIKKLSKAYLSKFEDEAIALERKATECRNAILIPGALEQIIIQELLDIKDKYGQPRACSVIKESDITGVPSGNFKVVITENNFIKKIGVDDKVSAKDTIKFVLTDDNNSNLLFFDNIGRVYNIPMSKIPFADKNSNGVDLRIINKYLNAPLTAVISEEIMKSFKNGYMITLTKNGYIKRMENKDFLTVPFSGLVYGKLDGGDFVTDILLIGGTNNDAVVYSRNKAIKIPLDNIPLLKRNSRGCMSMSNVDNVEGLSIIPHGSTDIVVVTTKGYFNRLILETVPTSKTKRGSNVIKLGKEDNIVSVLGVGQTSSLHCITMSGETFRINVSEIPNGSSIGSGVRLIPAKSGQVVKVSFVQ